jgi:hypothetical protein
MKRIFTVALLGASLFSCKNSNHGNDGKVVTAEDFFKVFPDVNLPLNISDTGIQDIGNTSTINHEVFTQFIPDSVLQSLLVNQAEKYAIFPVGIIHEENEDYLLTKFSSGKATKLAVFVLNNKHEYVSSLQLLNNYDNDKYSHSVSITNEPTFIVKREKSGKNNELLYSKNGYAFNTTTNTFIEVVNDSNEDLKKMSEIINPIDTFPATNKYSGDYVTDKKNFISVRDGKDALTYTFFIHFEKNNGDCTGELKGEMSLTDESNLIYQESGDPCLMRFRFSGSSVNVREEGNCGNHRGITCPFDFTFKKKKQSKPL